MIGSVAVARMRMSALQREANTRRNKKYDDQTAVFLTMKGPVSCRKTGTDEYTWHDYQGNECTVEEAQEHLCIAHSWRVGDIHEWSNGKRSVVVFREGPYAILFCADSCDFHVFQHTRNQLEPWELMYADDEEQHFDTYDKAYHAYIQL